MKQKQRMTISTQRNCHSDKRDIMKKKKGPNDININKAQKAG